MTRAYTCSQRACSRQRGEHDDAHSSFLRQPGSQGGSSSTLSQSDSTRDLVRFTLTPCSHVYRLCAPRATLAILSLSFFSPTIHLPDYFPITEVETAQRRSRLYPDDWLASRTSGVRVPPLPLLTGSCSVAPTSLLTESRVTIFSVVCDSLQ